MSNPETLYRCETCGKWSHAKQMPKKHVRFVIDISGSDASPADWIDYREAEHDYEGGLLRNGGWSVACGPFSAWTAVEAA